MSEPRETEPDAALSKQSDNRSGLMRWLFRPSPGKLLLPATGALILGLDWILFSSNTLTAWLATPIAMVLGFVLGSVGTYLIQRRAAGDTWSRAALKALAAGIVVGLPWPVGGTLIGGWVLLSSGLGKGDGRTKTPDR